MPTSSSARLTSASGGGKSKTSSRGPPGSKSSSAKRSSKSNNDDDGSTLPPLATAEIIEKATLPLHGLSARDALTVWKALGLYIGEQLTQRRRVISIERFGVFGYNDASEALFLHLSVFLQSNRLKERVASQGLKGQPALAASAEPMSRVNSVEISHEYLQNCGRDVVDKVIAHVVAFIGKMAKQGRSLCLGLAPLGEWSCSGGQAAFKFTPEFQKQMLESIPTKTSEPTKPKKETRTPDEMRERGRSAHVEERREPESALTAQALENHTVQVGMIGQPTTTASRSQRQSRHTSSDHTSASRRVGWSEHETPPKTNRRATTKATAAPQVGGIVGRVRTKLLERCGDRGLNALHRVLSLLDTSGDGILSAQELKFGLRDLGIELSPSELQQVVKYFDRNNDGVVSLDELLSTLRGPLSDTRRRLIDMAFDCMDREQRGAVSLDDLRGDYDVSLLPRVRAGKKTKVQAMNEFLREWETSVEHNNAIPRDAFLEYYHNVSAGIPDDSDFELLMRQTWHVSLPDSDPESDSEKSETEHDHTRLPMPKATKPDEPAPVSNSTDDEWTYLRSVLLPPPRGVHTQPTLDDVCRRLGVNRVWGDGNETMNTRAFANALGRLDRQLDAKDAQRFAHVIAQSCDGSGSDMIALSTVFQLLTNPSSLVGVKAAPVVVNATGIVDRVRARLLQRLRSQSQDRGETDVPTFLGFHALQRTLRLLDSNGDKRLSKDELKLGLRKLGVEINFHELDQLFTCLDADRSGCIDMDEFLVAMRGGDEALTKNPRRLALVHTAFDRLDRDRDGSVTLQELSRAYDTSKHPDVVAGRLTPDQALRQFASQWDTVDKDGIITRREFEVYYRNVSALIDSDDYFELMMRNAWHISGGTGQCANTSNRRVLVTKADGSQSVQEIQNDLGIRATDRDKIHENLRAQGIEAADFAITGFIEDKRKQKGNLVARPLRQSDKNAGPTKPQYGRRKAIDAGSPQQDRAGPRAFFAAREEAVDTVQNDRQLQRQLREHAALLIQSQFRGFKCRKFADCVRRQMAAEKLRQQRDALEQAPRKRVLTRAALKSYYGF